MTNYRSSQAIFELTELTIGASREIRHALAGDATLGNKNITDLAALLRAHQSTHVGVRHTEGSYRTIRALADGFPYKILARSLGQPLSQRGEVENYSALGLAMQLLYERLERIAGGRFRKETAEKVLRALKGIQSGLFQRMDDLADNLRLQEEWIL